MHRQINVLITFDDGFINNYEYVFPILVKHGLKATFFLIVDCVETEATRVIAERSSRATEEAGTEYRTLSLSQIQEMMAAGMTFGSHTFSHTDLTQTEWAEGISIASGSAERLGTLLGRDVQIIRLSVRALQAGPARSARGLVRPDLHDGPWIQSVGRRRHATRRGDQRPTVAVCRVRFARSLLDWGQGDRKGLGPDCRARTAFLGSAPAGCFDQFNRSEAINPNSKSKPLIAFVPPSRFRRRRRLLLARPVLR